MSSHIEVYEINNGKMKELNGEEFKKERELQNLVENNLETILGVKFLATEYVIENGRIDTLGIDENNSPVIIEYKRNQHENIITQSLFYLDWINTHRGDFQILVQEKLSKEISDNINWNNPSVFCIAKEFSRYDANAVNIMQRNIKLVKYKHYSNNTLLFEYINQPISNKINKPIINKKSMNKKDSNVYEFYKIIDKNIFEFGDDIEKIEQKHYIAYKRIKNFCCLELLKNSIKLSIKLNLDEYKNDDFVRDVTNIGHYGVGNAQLIINNEEDAIKAINYIKKSYDEN